jgi:hypothetical protein
LGLYGKIWVQKRRTDAILNKLAGKPAKEPVTMNEQTAQKRRELISRLFPGGIPRIWCPLLTQYTPDGGIDAFRMRALLRSLAPHVGGLMLTGDLGDGWQLSRRQCDQVLAACLDDARALGMRVLFAVAEEESQDAYGTIVYHLEALARIHGKDSALKTSLPPAFAGTAFLHLWRRSGGSAY